MLDLSLECTWLKHSRSTRRSPASHAASPLSLLSAPLTCLIDSVCSLAGNYVGPELECTWLRHSRSTRRSPASSMLPQSLSLLSAPVDVCVQLLFAVCGTTMLVQRAQSTLQTPSKSNSTLLELKYAAARPCPYCQHPARNDQTTRNDQARIANQKNVFRTRFFFALFSSAMSSAPIRHVDAGHVLMSDGWVVRGTARPALLL